MKAGPPVARGCRSRRAPGGHVAAVFHARAVRGWTRRQQPKDKYETARCKDASLSCSRHSQGTCSHHHGVRYWFK
ncbi:DUF3761 domain-containing protein [Streptomyces sp. NPDC001480]|uniref:DUF3761 domain-containing protein n=1 Tax=Streptomyces sp. NPDC001480 TaxID=3364577 RepID=UPI003677B594